jgi:hypothetical protein
VAAMAELRVEEGNLVDALRRALADRDASGVVSLMAALSTFWDIEGDHLKLVNVASEVEDVVVEAVLADDREDPLRVVLGAVLVNTLILSGEPAIRSLARLRELGAGHGDPRAVASTTVLLALAESFTAGEVRALDKLYDAPDRLTALWTRQWTSHARENAGDIAGAFRAAEDGLALCREEDGPWMRAMLTAQLSVLATQQGDVDAARSYAERALPDMDRLGAVEDGLQLRALLAVSDMTAGRLQEAERVLAAIGEDERTHSILGGLMIVLCGNAELALARGDVERGLTLYRDAVVALRARSIPGVDRATELTPWVLYPSAGALAAHARHRSPEGAALYEHLLHKAAAVLSEARGLLDFPMTGAVLFALGLWQVTLEDQPPRALSQAVRMLVLADAFAYNRLLPSLSWDTAAAVAEERARGQVAAARAEIAGRNVAELRADAVRLVAELDIG